MSSSFAVVIVGGGSAGLSAALVLGRSRRSVLLCDTGQWRNRASHAVHCLLGHEGVAPAELMRKAKRELERYTTVRVLGERVTTIVPTGDVFAVTCANGFTAEARKVLLATGLVDDVPGLEGIERFYGRSVHHCPYCDGFEHRDQPLAVYGAGDKGAGLALMMKQWSADIVLLTDGQDHVSAEMEARLRHHRILVFPEEIVALEGTDEGDLRAIRLRGGKTLERTAMFFTTGCRQASDFSAVLGCRRDDKGGIVADPVTEESSVRGVYVAGDASRDVLLVAAAIGEGAKAGVAINRALLHEDGLC
jgi:thioredoxin reductase